LELKSLGIKVIVSNNDDAQSAAKFGHQLLFTELFVQDSKACAETGLYKLVPVDRGADLRVRILTALRSSELYWIHLPR
jgi:hypothetical protein